MRSACETGVLKTMAAATYLVHKGVPFRKAHEKIGLAVRYGLERGCELGGLTLEGAEAVWAGVRSRFFCSITLDATVNCHDVIGTPDSYYAAPAMDACAAFCKESRMKFGDPNKV
jgi:argininosuccinate lyase